MECHGPSFPLMLLLISSHALICGGEEHKKMLVICQPVELVNYISFMSRIF